MRLPYRTCFATKQPILLALMVLACGRCFAQAPATPISPAPASPAPPPVAVKRKQVYAPLTAAPARLLVDGDLDLRYRGASSGRSHETYVQNVELDLLQPIVTESRQTGAVYLQLIGENPADVTHPNGISEVRLGEAYLTYRLPVLTSTDSSAYLKIGQFTPPFGLLPVYDTHLQILQSLYAESLGVRTDWGVGLEGRFSGVLDYRFAITSGVGPDHVYITPDRVVSFRLGRLFATRYGTFSLGGSMLGGRLPVTKVNPLTGFEPTLPPSGYVTPIYGYENKTRIAGDGQWTFRSLTARGEADTGADSQTRVLGYFVDVEYRFAPGLTAVVARRYWDFGRGNSTEGDDSIGINIAYGNNTVIRTLYEDQENVAESNTSSVAPLEAADSRRHILTVQLLLRF